MPSKPIKFAYNGETITLAHGGKSHVVRKGAPNFKGLFEALDGQKWDEVPEWLTAKKAVEAWSKGAFSVEGDIVSYKGRPLPVLANAKVLEIVRANADLKPFEAFWQRLDQNIDYAGKDAVWKFLQHMHIPISRDGYIVAYKSVTKAFKDHYTGNFDNSPGKEHEMPRQEVTYDENIDCGRGFHAGSLHYAQTTWSGAKIVIVRIDPADVVSVPHDSDQQKVRVCRYKVIGHFTEPLPSTLFDENVGDDVGVKDRRRSAARVSPDADDLVDTKSEAEVGAKTETPKTTKVAKSTKKSPKKRAAVVTRAKAKIKAKRTAKPAKKVIAKKKQTKWKKYARLDFKGLFDLTMDELLGFAKHLRLVGVTKMPKRQLIKTILGR